MTKRGALNAWQCSTCGKSTVAVHVDDGVTPMFLGCRATPGCIGRATSSGYPSGPVPHYIVEALRFEWYAPSPTELVKLDQETRAHCGLLIRDLTNDGRRAWAEVER